MTPFSKLKFLRTQKGRHKTLLDVMPVDENFAYFVVLSDAYLSINQDEKHVRNFKELQAIMGNLDGLQALQIVRSKGQITEGHHELPDIVASYIANIGVASLHVRRWVAHSSEPILTTLPLANVKDGWSSSPFEEVEVCDSLGKLYFRAKDDEPLIFFAVLDSRLSDKIRRCKKFCREVSGEFEYTL